MTRRKRLFISILVALAWVGIVTGFHVLQYGSGDVWTFLKWFMVIGFPAVSALSYLQIWFSEKIQPLVDFALALRGSKKKKS